MNSLKNILQRASDRRSKAGGSSDELIRNLQAYRQQQLTIFIFIEVVLVLGLAFCAYYLTKNPINPGKVKLLSGLIGGGACGGIEMMRRIWKDWSQTQLLLILLPESTEAQVGVIIDTLRKKL